ncbi:hypothetical protein C8Q78DRAFT_1079697 [Trametes maxima]|nr:hypothetical protein C8Q78DRAFT_1079697 [Trametes maxima]
MPGLVADATRVWELNLYWPLHAQCGVWDPKGKGVDVWECIRPRKSVYIASHNFFLTSSLSQTNPPPAPSHQIATTGDTLRADDRHRRVHAPSSLLGLQSPSGSTPSPPDVRPLPSDTIWATAYAFLARVHAEEAPSLPLPGAVRSSLPAPLALAHAIRIPLTPPPREPRSAREPGAHSRPRRTLGMMQPDQGG